MFREGKHMAPRRDTLALQNAYMAERYFLAVIAPTLEKLVPISQEQVGDPKKHLVQIARDNGHNELCYETRLSLALTMGAMFERRLRFWMSKTFPENATEIRTANYAGLLSLLGTDVETATLRELCTLSNTARHGEGSSAEVLKDSHTRWWDHLGDILRDRYFANGLGVYTLRIADCDLERYNRAILHFWRELAIQHRAKRRVLTPPFRSDENRAVARK